MNITPMSMNPNIARVHYKEYRKRVREHRAARLAEANRNVVEGGKRFRAGRLAKSLIEKEDETLMESYHAMAQGMRIINVASVLHGAGLDSKKRLPVLALAGAHWENCFLLWDNHYSAFEFAPRQWGATRCNGPNTHRDNAELTNGCTAFPLHTFTPTLQNQEWRKGQNLPLLPVKAIVPSIPVHLRPAGDLKDYAILFEAVWEHAPPVDPILLKKVHGHMYAVLAQWDLTPIERAVLEGRIS